jgi:hypothetical protein
LSAVGTGLHGPPGAGLRLGALISVAWEGLLAAQPT